MRVNDAIMEVKTGATTESLVLCRKAAELDCDFGPFSHVAQYLRHYGAH